MNGEKVPLVTTVIPTYHEPFSSINRAISSVVEQTYENIEIIVVDDSGEQRLNQDCLKGHNPKLINHSKNRGGGAARNTGVRYARGKYIAFLDADDEWMPYKIEKQVKQLKSRSNKWVASHCDTYSSSNKLLNLISQKGTTSPEGGRNLTERLLRLELGFDGTSTLLVRKEIFIKIGGFDSDFPRYQDWELLIRLLECGKLAYIDEELVRRNNTGNPDPDSHKKSVELLFEKYPKFAEECQYEKIHNHYVGESYLRDGQFQEAFLHLEFKRILSFRGVYRFSMALMFGLGNYISSRKF